MDEQVAVEENTELRGLIERVERGEEIVITRDGKPVARLVQTPPTFDRAKAEAAAQRILELSKGQTLGGPSIKDLINEGSSGLAVLP
jgi:prevent-host-death family protein